MRNEIKLTSKSLEVSGPGAVKVAMAWFGLRALGLLVAFAAIWFGLGGQGQGDLIAILANLIR